MRIHEIINEAPLPPEWDSAVYTPQVSYKKRIEYAVQRALRLGKGSSRTAFEIEYEGRPTVLKVAHNAKGIAQNAAEIDILDDGYFKTSGILIPLIDYDTANTSPVWIHTEKASKATEKQLCTLMKCGKLQWLVNAAIATESGRGDPHEYDEEILKMYGGTDTFFEYSDMLAELAGVQLNLRDFSTAANWGIYKGSPVVIDVGFTDAVKNAHYSR